MTSKTVHDPERCGWSLGRSTQGENFSKITIKEEEKEEKKEKKRGHKTDSELEER